MLYPEVNTVLPESGKGFINFRREQGGADQYGTRSTIESIIRIGEVWNRSHPTRPFSIGDISRKGGGYFPPHGSHRTGLDADVRPLRSDGANLPVKYYEPAYDRELSRQFMKTVRANARIKLILFNDPILIREGLCQRYSGHDDHFHIRFEPNSTPVVRVLEIGMSGEDVKVLQTALVNKGFLKGSIDGKFGPMTEAAVKAFQKANGLTADGKVGPKTRVALGI